MPFYMFSRACRQVVLNYMNIQLQEAGNHWDGSEWVQLPDVMVKDRDLYDPRQLPAVVTDNVTGSLQGISFDQNVYRWEDEAGTYGPKKAVYQVLGGRGNFDVSIFCASNDKETQQRLTDVVAYYLTIGRGWVYYNRHLLLGEVRFLGDGVDERVPQEKVYFASLSVPVSADWRLIIQRDTVQKIMPDIDLVTPDDPFPIPEMQMPPIQTPLDPAGGPRSEQDLPTTDVEDPSKFLMEGPENKDLPLRPMKSSRTR